ncbi:MAG: tetratricopeptide repeat protein [Candidatus Korobacteraceae bacterium]
MASVDLTPAKQGHSRLAASPRKQSILHGLLLIIAIVAVYFPVHAQPFANFDDADYVFDNFHVRSGLNWNTVHWAFVTWDAANWHPLTWLSHALDAQIFGMDPAGPHDVNVLFHVLNALLLFWVLQRATGYVGRSWMVAALFALHPINVESVAWIAERKNLLSMFFLLLTLGAYRWYARQPRDSRYVVVAALFAMGLMSKPQVITLPFLLLLWDYWPLQRFSFAGDEAAAPTGAEPAIPRKPLSYLIWEKVPLLGLCVASAYITMRAQQASGATSSYAASIRLGNAIVSYARYVENAFWPLRLSVFYPYPGNSLKAWQVGGAFLFLLAVTAWVIYARRRRYLPVGWFWFLGTLVPMIGLVQVGTQAMADRYAYLPLVGLFLMICWGVADWASEKQVPAAVLPSVSAVILLALMPVTYRQVRYWNDHITLWTHALQVTNNNWLAENNLGTALLKAGSMEAAVPHFRAAAALNPSDPNVNLNLGTYEQSRGNLPGAIERYKAAATAARNSKLKARAYNNLGYAYRDLGDYPDALDSFEQAVKWNPEFGSYWVSLGVTEQKSGDLTKAIAAYSQGMQIQPSDFGYLLLARALQESGQTLPAQEATRKAEQLSPNIDRAQQTADRLLSH